MQRRFGLGFLVTVAASTLVLGTIAGAIAGGLTAYFITPSSHTDAEESGTRVSSLASVTPVATIADRPTATPTMVPTPVPATPEPTAIATEDTESVADIVARVGTAVVTVVNEQQAGDLFGSTELQPAGTGTGFIIDDQGHVITNNHVVEGSQEIKVIFADGTEQKAQLLGSDSFADLAVVKVDGPVPATIPLGDSDDLRPGDRVIAIGSALGDFTNTVTEGIISALNRSLQTSNGYNMENMLQHDAPINPGNSGGPLLSLTGEVVGVNTAVVRQAEAGVTAEGLGFAIPINTVDDITTQIIKNGKVIRPYLGISYEPLTPRAAKANNLPVDHGIVVTSTEPESPAATAGIRRNDILTKINDQDIDSDNALMNLLFHYKVGDTVEISAYRASTGSTVTLNVTLAATPDNN